MNYNRITRPELLLNEAVCRSNIAFMTDKCRKLGVHLNPHFKTHQSGEIGNWFGDYGVNRITVSSIKMAEYFIGEGWTNVTVAFPFNIRETEVINGLPEEVKVTLDVIEKETADFLSRNLKRPVSVMIEVDAGYARTGIPVEDTGKIDSILDIVRKSPLLDFYGFYIHAGHTYDVQGKNSVDRIHQQSLGALRDLKEKYIRDWPGLKLSLGDTPSCSMMEDFDGIDEIRPGNFVFYDLMQEQIGACSFENIAVVMAAPVVSKEASRKEIVVHGGAVHLSKDFITGKNGKPVFGLIGTLNVNGWSAPVPGCYIRKLSQEHGIVCCSDYFFDKIRLGDLVVVYPVHSCLTAECLGRYLSLDGSRIEMMAR